MVPVLHALCDHVPGRRRFPYIYNPPCHSEIEVPACSGELSPSVRRRVFCTHLTHTANKWCDDMAFVCQFCDRVWPSARSLASHAVVHAKDQARRRLTAPLVQGPAMVPVNLLVVDTVLSLAPPPLAPAVVPAAPPLHCPRRPAPAPLRAADHPSQIQMAPLDHNPAFWVRYRLGMEGLKDFLGLEYRRPTSPPASFEDWISDPASDDSSED